RNRTLLQTELLKACPKFWILWNPIDRGILLDERLQKRLHLQRWDKQDLNRFMDLFTEDCQEPLHSFLNDREINSEASRISLTLKHDEQHYFLDFQPCNNLQSTWKILWLYQEHETSVI